MSHNEHVMNYFTYHNTFYLWNFYCSTWYYHAIEFCNTNLLKNVKYFSYIFLIQPLIHNITQHIGEHWLYIWVGWLKKQFANKNFFCPIFATMIYRFRSITSFVYVRTDVCVCFVFRWSCRICCEFFTIFKSECSTFWSFTQQSDQRNDSFSLE